MSQAGNQAGKGDKQRPRQITYEQYTQNYEAIFGDKAKVKNSETITNKEVKTKTK